MGLWDSIKSFGSSALSSVTGGLLDFGGSVLQDKYINQPNSAQAFIDSKEGAAKQYEREKESSALQFSKEYGAYKNRYKDTMADMKNAGLNPILASSSGFNVGSGPSASKANVSSANAYLTSQPNVDPTKSGLNLKQSDKTETDTKNIAKQTIQVIQQIKKIGGETAKIAQETQNLILTLEKIKAETKKISAQAGQQQVKEKSYKILDNINNGYMEIIKLWNSKPSQEKINKTMTTINNYYNTIIQKAKNWKNKPWTLTPNYNK